MQQLLHMVQSRQACRLEVRQKPQQQLLGSTGQRMIGSVIQSQFVDANNYPAAAALSTMLMLLILAMVLVYVRRAGTEELL